MLTAAFPNSGRSRYLAPIAAGAHCLLLSLVVTLALPLAATAQWEDSEVVVLAGSEADEWSNRFSLAVDAENAPHAVWSSGSLVFYDREDDGEWIPPIEIGHDDAFYSAHAIAIAPGTTTPSVLYSRRPIGQQSGDLFLATWTGAGFDEVQLTDDELAEHGPALAMDASGAYHVICVSEVEDVWRLRYLTNVTGEPAEQIVDAGPLGAFGSGASPCIAAKDDGVVHIAYRGIWAGFYKIHHAANNEPGGTSWSWEVMISDNEEDFSSDIEIDASGGIHLAVSGSDCWGCNPRTYYFHQPEGDPWDPYIFIPLTMGLSSPSLALDRYGAPHVAMAEVAGNIYTGRLYYASANNGWTPVLIIGTDHGEPSLAVDGVGYGHLVCMTGPNTGIEDVLYLRSGDVVVGVNDSGPALHTISFCAMPNPFTRAIVFRLDGVWDAREGPDCTICVYDLSGRLVRRLAPGLGSAESREIEWDGLDEAGKAASPGVYFARVKIGRVLSTTKIMLAR